MLDIEDTRVADLFRKANDRGDISLEMEGKEAPVSANSMSFDLLRNAFT